jgi:two-component system, LytTR family, response regulator
MTAILIDDEKKGREILHKLLQNYCPEVNVSGMAANADEGYELILKHKPDVVFLDIEMPNSNGFDLLERFDKVAFQVIFTTAFDSYAIKAIKHHALDYLMKPIDIDELQQAVANAKKMLQSKEPDTRYGALLDSRKPVAGSRLPLTIKDGIVYLQISDILRIESDGGYSTFYASGGQKYLVSKNLKEYEELLPPGLFFRVHKSHLINIRKVRKYLRTDGHFVEMEDGALVEISRRKKDEFLQVMNEQG